MAMNQIDQLRGPLLISWQLTRGCDLACLHCCTLSAPGRRLPDELDRAAALRFADAIVEAEVPSVMLCGGEPTIVPHFFEVAERLGACGVQLKIETNGQGLTEAMAERLCRLPIRSVQISLDGDSEAVYARQRPGGSLARAHAACRLVRQAGMTLEITFAPTRLNIHEAEKVIARARMFGAARFNSGALMPIGRAAQLWSKLSLSAESLAYYRAFLDTERARIDQTMQLCYEPFTLADGLTRSLVMPPATLLILPNGMVRLTGALDYTCGDVRCMSLEQIWNRYCAAWRDAGVRESIRQDIGRATRQAGLPVKSLVVEEGVQYA